MNSPGKSRTLKSIAIIGAGCSGLAAAHILHDAGNAVTVFERSQEVGGRAATRQQQGFIYDHGAQYIKGGSAVSSALITERFRAADLVVLGPGSLFTTVLASLLFRGIAAALHEARGQVIYLCNTTTQPGQTDGYTTLDHVRRIVEALGRGALDAVLINRSRPDPATLAQYEADGVFLLQPDEDQIAAIAATLSAFSAKAVRTAWTRVTKSCTAGFVASADGVTTSMQAALACGKRLATGAIPYNRVTSNVLFCF